MVFLEALTDPRVMIRTLSWWKKRWLLMFDAGYPRVLAAQHQMLDRGEFTLGC